MNEQSGAESSNGTNSSPPKVPVFATVGRAYRFVFVNIGQILLCLVQLAIVSSLPAILISGTFPSAISSVLTLIWSIATMAPFAILVHRAILLGEPLDATKYLPSFRDPRTSKFILLGFTIYGFPLLLQLGSSLLVEKNLLLSGILNVAYVIATFYVLRYMLTFPAVATDRFTDLSDAHWLLMGSIVRMFFAMLVAFLPVFVVMFILVQDSVAEAREVNPWFSLFGLLLAPVFPAVLSFAYKDRMDLLHGGLGTASSRTE